MRHQRGTGPGKTFRNSYNALGYLHRVERWDLFETSPPELPTGTANAQAALVVGLPGTYGVMSPTPVDVITLWQATQQDAAQHVLTATLGNGLTVRRTFNPHSGRLTAASLDTASGSSRALEGYAYDELGNVTQRNQWWEGAGFSEVFSYDGLNRLKTAQVLGQAVKTFDYDAIGNMLSKTGVGSGAFSYPPSGAARPHAVQSIAGLGAYGYDDNGNLVSAPGGTTLSWKSFDMPDTITRGGVFSQFAYGPEHQRARQTRSSGAVLYYAGAMEVESTSGAVTVKTYWPGGLGVEIDRPGQPVELLWTHADRLGSVIAITGSAGTFKEKLAYDAWGKRRTTDGSATPNSLDGQTDHRGFTGHEMLDNVDMVHMNGRVYDPFIARFVSADPIIQDPEHSQSYNRYSYVWNNPTNLTDPTGFVVGKEDDERRQGFVRHGGGNWVTTYLSPPNGAAGSGGEGASGKENSRETKGLSLNSVLNPKKDPHETVSGGTCTSPTVACATQNEEYRDARQGIAKRQAIIPIGPVEEVLLGGAVLKRILGLAAGALSGLVRAEAAGVEALAAKGVATEAKLAKEGIYEFREGARTYCGQSCNIPGLLQQHIDSGKLTDALSTVKTTEVLGGKTAREIAEHRRIQEITGGVPARFSDRVSNKFDPIGPNRSYLLD